jgi:acyl carrier protein
MTPVVSNITELTLTQEGGKKMGTNIKQQVRQYILDNFMMGGAADIPDDASFMDRHIIDSTGFLELISFVEQAFAIQIADDEMMPENLDSLNNIERFVQQKRAAMPAMAAGL